MGFGGKDYPHLFPNELSIPKESSDLCQGLHSYIDQDEHQRLSVFARLEGYNKGIDVFILYLGTLLYRSQCLYGDNAHHKPTLYLVGDGELRTRLEQLLLN